MKYNKPPLPLIDQLDRLITRGMIVDNAVEAEHALGHLNYYRLRAYWYPFEQNNTTHLFKPDARFEDVLNIYQFDQQLRLLLLDALGQIEVSLRTQWALHFSLAHGAFAYLEPAYNRKPDWLRRNKVSLRRELDRSDEVFIKHFQSKYTSHDYPPIWMACEIMSFGLFSKWYNNLRPASVQADIAQNYGLDKSVLPSLLEHFVYLRNVCAHHGRVWNKSLVVTPRLPKTKPHSLHQSLNLTQTRKIYNSLVMIAHFLRVISPRTAWQKQLWHLLDTHKIDLEPMGFPADWQERPYWQEVAE